MNKLITITLLAILLTTQLVLAESADPINQLINHVSQEHQKTRLELTKYADAKFSQYDERITTEIKPFIDENFKIFDDRMHALATQFILQLTLALFLTIIIANAVWFIIKRSLERLRKPKNPTIKDQLTQKKYGMITQEYQTKITKEDETIIKNPILQERENTPQSPDMQQIQAILEKKRAEEQKKIAEENAKKLAKIAELEAKAEKKTRRIKKQITEISNTITPTSPAELTILPPEPPRGL